jgi:hypothetical protein
MFPTDAEPPSKKIQLAIALGKPWYQSLLPDVMRIRASVRCDFYPGLN